MKLVRGLSLRCAAGVEWALERTDCAFRPCLSRVCRIVLIASRVSESSSIFVCRSSKIRGSIIPAELRAAMVRGYGGVDLGYDGGRTLDRVMKLRESARSFQDIGRQDFACRIATAQQNGVKIRRAVDFTIARHKKKVV